jgi:hypothetical protein
MQQQMRHTHAAYHNIQQNGIEDPDWSLPAGCHK